MHSSHVVLPSATFCPSTPPLVYILETEESFTYLILGEHTWAPLKEAMNREIPVYLAAEEQTLELIQLHQELNYLIDNIKDNANYGDMEEKVKSTFL